jgi:restriction endonuclease S subunit
MITQQDIILDHIIADILRNKICKKAEITQLVGEDGYNGIYLELNNNCCFIRIKNVCIHISIYNGSIPEFFDCSLANPDCFDDMIAWLKNAATMTGLACPYCPC